MIDREALRIRRKRGIIMARRYRNQLTPRNIGLLGTTPRPCSCWMCGNPRRHSKGDFAITMQERMAKLADGDYADISLDTPDQRV